VLRIAEVMLLFIDKNNA